MPRIVTEFPLREHTDVVSDEKLTGRPDDAKAFTRNGGSPNILLGSAANDTVCGLPAIVIAKVWVASGAVPLPALNVPANAPVAVGVPLIRPLLPLSVRPGGSAAAVTAKVGAGTPDAVNLKLYGLLRKPL